MNNYILKLITGSNKYAGQIANFSSILEQLNKEFLQILKDIGITEVNLTVLGNSIASGYSMKGMAKPLLLRNATLRGLANENSIQVNYYNFARMQDNNDEKLLRWIYENTKQSEINRQNRVDYETVQTMANNFNKLSDKDLEEYFPLSLEEDKGLYDLICENQGTLANIIVYSGCTGSFLDNFTRHGQHLNLDGFDRDLASLEGILKLIYLKSPNTQIYVTGLPNFLGINITQIINKRIKAICRKYVNATYVEPVAAHMLYQENGELSIDIHHNECEYLNLNSNIMASIISNYLKNRFKIELAQFLSATSDRIQFGDQTLKNDKTIVEKFLNDLLVKYRPLFEKYNINIQELLSDFTEYYKERYPHDYFYTPKKEVEEIFGNQK